MDKNFSMIIPEPVRIVINKLNDAGYSAHCVGGCVRDSLMGKIPYDYDVTTSARPDEMQNVFKGMRVVETGLQHGTITVVLSGMNIEITTYRIDGSYGDNRHPEEVTFTDRLSDDLCRRDFTVNAMAYSEKEGLTDLYGGINDLNAGIIRCVGCARERFSEDGLRILRALRFSSVLNFTPDKECSEAIKELTPLLANISRERIHAELSKLLAGVNCSEILISFADTISYALNISPEHVKNAGEKLKDYPRGDSLMNLAVILSGVTYEEATEVISSLKPSREEKNIIQSYLKYMNYSQTDSYSVRHLISQTDDAFPVNLAKYRLILTLSGEEEYSEIIRLTNEIIENNLCRSLADLAVKGGDLTALGFKGQEIGNNLKNLLDKVLKDELPNDKNVLISSLEVK